MYGCDIVVDKWTSRGHVVRVPEISLLEGWRECGKVLQYVALIIYMFGSFREHPVNLRRPVESARTAEDSVH
jgi:hypothetical protein